MPQQVNLCLPILRKQPQRFAAQSLALALAVILVLGAALGAAWVWNLNQAAQTLQATLDAQSKELDGLRAALERARASTGESAALQKLQQRRRELLERQSLLQALSQGLYEPGQGHAARLELVAQTIPPQVWVTHLKTDNWLLELGGYTLEPAALNDWVSALAASPLLQGQSLATAQVEGVKPTAALLTARTGAAQPAAATATASAAPMWSFSLLSAVAATPATTGNAGAKP